ncbi:MAG TPA: hypothetical protein VMU20_14655 [Candidatus Dormibacteraeota bacterium]|nr:hypothetical protein [Candidatus Dormibacteraeota bacterium]
MAPAQGRRGIAAAAVAIAVGGAAAASSIGVSAHSTKAKLPTAPKGFSVSVFAKATAAFWNPDSVELAGNHVWVGYQNTTAKDGSDGLSSTVVEYSLSGKLRATFSVLGHVDGVRVDPSTGLVWVLSNEDANPHLTTIDPVAGTTKQYAMTSVNGGGGFDDIAFLGGKAFISASNPTLNGAGVNVFPAIVSATLDNATDSVDTTPVLFSSANLNLTDPDSMYVVPSGARAGDLQLDDQADAQLVFISGPGGPAQSVSTLPIGNQMDDTILPTSPSGTLLVSDTTKTGAVYAIKSKQWDTTKYLSSAPNDSQVIAYTGTIDTTVNPSSGFATNKPLITGFSNPHGEAFIPKTSH